jgi:hypothetical protein
MKNNPAPAPPPMRRKSRREIPGLPMAHLRLSCPQTPGLPYIFRRSAREG